MEGILYMRWSFIIKVTDEMRNKEIKDAVDEKAQEVVSSVGEAPENSIFKVAITFYQSRDRWLKDNPQMPREDWGGDLDNLVKPVFDSLGAIIGRRTSWKKQEQGGYKATGQYASFDARIVEVVAKKVNSGSNEEFLSIEVESIS